MCARSCARAASTLPEWRLASASLPPSVLGDWGRRPPSFNYKLAVLVSEADGQIRKVRRAHLILVNLPLHI